MLRSPARQRLHRDSQKCGNSVLRTVTFFPWNVTTFLYRIALNSNVLHIMPIGCVRESSPGPAKPASLDRLDEVTLARYPPNLALDLLNGCGMMPRSDGAICLSDGKCRPFQQFNHCRSIEGFAGGFFPSSLPKILGAFSLLYLRKIKFPLVNLFGGTLRLNERLGCHDPFIEWAR